MVDAAYKVRESRSRRHAKRLGLFLRKSKAKCWSLHNRGGYMIIDPYANTVVWGPDFEMDLAGVESQLTEYEAKLSK